jgi:hypothetical protein
MPVTAYLYDAFPGDLAAPLPSPRNCNPGPGQLAIIQPTSGLSVVAGRLRQSAGPTAVNYLSEVTQRARVIGLAAFARLYDAANNALYDTIFGWGSQSGISVSGGALWRFSGNNLVTVEEGGSGPGGQYAVFGYVHSDVEIAVVCRSNGAFWLIKGGPYPDWRLAWVGANSTQGIGGFAIRMGGGTTNVLQEFDEFRDVLLPAPWNTDYGIAVQRIAGTPPQGVLFSHAADAIIEWIQTALPSAAGNPPTTIVQFRRQDAGNCWQAEISPAGDLALVQVLAGVRAVKASAAAKVQPGDRLIAICDGNNLSLVTQRNTSPPVNGASLSATSGGEFATQTTGMIAALGGGAISNLASWPRNVAPFVPNLTPSNTVVINSGVTGEHRYALARERRSQQFWNGGALEDFVQVNWPSYAVPAPELATSAIYILTIPGMPAGTYDLLGRKNAGGPPAPADQMDPQFTSRAVRWDGFSMQDTAAPGDAMQIDPTTLLELIPPETAQIDAALSATHGAGAWDGQGTVYGTSGTLTVTVTEQDPQGQPIPQVEVWISQDAAGLQRTQSDMTDAMGQAHFRLDPQDAWLWRSKAGWNWSPNPMPVTIGTDGTVLHRVLRAAGPGGVRHAR